MSLAWLPDLKLTVTSRCHNKIIVVMYSTGTQVRGEDCCDRWQTHTAGKTRTPSRSIQLLISFVSIYLHVSIFIAQIWRKKNNHVNTSSKYEEKISVLSPWHMVVSYPSIKIDKERDSKFSKARQLWSTAFQIILIKSSTESAGQRRNHLEIVNRDWVRTGSCSRKFIHLPKRCGTSHCHL